MRLFSSRGISSDAIFPASSIPRPDVDELVSRNRCNPCQSSFVIVDFHQAAIFTSHPTSVEAHVWECSLGHFWTPCFIEAPILIKCHDNLGIRAPDTGIEASLSTPTHLGISIAEHLGELRLFAVGLGLDLICIVHEGGLEIVPRDRSLEIILQSFESNWT